MEENLSSLIFGIANDYVSENDCYIPNCEDTTTTDPHFRHFDHPAYINSYNSVLRASTDDTTVANELKENSPYSSPRLSTEESENENDPFSQRCRIPVPNLVPLSRYHMWLETSFMCKRNERERQRVRNVNDGFSRLRNHLPRSANMRRRQSKVETLQRAIKYIKYLQDLLEDKKGE